MILIVTYDLKTSRDYTPFYEALKQQGTWWHYIASTWLISTAKSPEEVVQSLHPYMDTQDFLFVAELGARFNGYLPKEAWEWIYAQLATTTLRRPTLLEEMNKTSRRESLADQVRQAREAKALGERENK